MWPGLSMTWSRRPPATISSPSLTSRSLATGRAALDDRLGPGVVEHEEVVGDVEGAAPAAELVAAADDHALPLRHEGAVDGGGDDGGAGALLDLGADAEVVDVAVGQDQLLDVVGFDAGAPDQRLEVLDGPVETRPGVDQGQRVAQEQVDVDGADVEGHRAAEADDVVGHPADAVVGLDQSPASGAGLASRWPGASNGRAAPWWWPNPTGGSTAARHVGLRRLDRPCVTTSTRPC